MPTVKVAGALRVKPVRTMTAPLLGVEEAVEGAVLVRTLVTHLRTITKAAMADPSLMTTSLQPKQAAVGALGTTRTPVTPVVLVAVAPAKHTREAYPAP